MGNKLKTRLLHWGRGERTPSLGHQSTSQGLTLR